MERATAGSVERKREQAFNLLERALAILDQVGPARVAATVSMALAQAGREPPAPPLR